MDLTELASCLVDGKIDEAAFRRLYEKTKHKDISDKKQRKKRISSEGRKAREAALICVLGLVHQKKWERKTKTDFDYFLSELCGLCDSTEIRRARSKLNQLLKKNDVFIKTSDKTIIVSFLKKKKYRRGLLYKHILESGEIVYLDYHPEHITKYILKKSEDVIKNEFKLG